MTLTLCPSIRCWLVWPLAIILLTSASAWSQSLPEDSPKNSPKNSPKDSADYSLEGLLELKATEEASALQKDLNQKVGVSSKKALSSRETPGIVSTITAEDIKQSGARDLLDVLQQVPGFEIGSDTEFVVGLGIRGNWANEGKVLMLIDGIEINETLFQTLQLGNRFPVDHIERIEIIRGPGSAIYGGNAEYGVVNIVTKGAGGAEEISVNSIYGQRVGSLARRNIGLLASRRFNHWHVDVSLFKGEGNRSDQPYASFFGTEVDNLADGYSQMNPTHLNVGVKYKNTSFRTIYDHYQTTSSEYLVDYGFFTASLKQDYRPHKKLLLTSQLTYTNHLPWHYKGYYEEGFEFNYKVRGERYKVNLSSIYDVTRKLNLVVGGEFFNDRATDRLGSENFGEGINNVHYNNYSVFAQGLLKHHLANVTTGFRYDYHNAFGSAFVPRIALTKRMGNVHFKALYSQSYRAPGIENLNLNPDIAPERSHIRELELGYQFTPEMLLTANLFHIRTQDAIIYNYNIDTDEEFYFNEARIGTQGIEAEYRIKQDRWSAYLSYSFYQASSKNTAATFQVPGEPHLNVGVPTHKIGVQGNYQIGKDFFVTPSLIYRGERYAYIGLDEEESPQLGRLEATTQVHLYCYYDNAFVPGLTLGAGVYNLLDQDWAIPQFYNGDYPPITVAGREFTLKLSYTLSFR